MNEELAFYFGLCRLCFSAFKADEMPFNLSKEIIEKFEYICNIELKTSSILSQKVCKVCLQKVIKLYENKAEMISKQEKLYNIIACLDLDNDLEEYSSAVPSFEIEILNSESQYHNEGNNDIKIKTEELTEEQGLGSKSIPEFSSVDFDVPSIAKYRNYQNQVEAKHKKKDPFRHTTEGASMQNRANKKSKSHYCPICKKFFTEKKKVKLHVQRVHQQCKDYGCDRCQYRANTKWDVLRHFKTKHMPSSQNEPKDLRICPDCGKVLKGNNHLNFHIKTKHLKLTKYSCDLCDFKSYGKYEIRSHIEIHHLPLELRKGFPCDLCSSVLTTAMSLKTHKIHKHINDRIHACFCGKTYSLKETLKSHIRNVHNGERKYKCPQCQKGFNSNPRLRDHINNTHGKKQEIPCSHEKCSKIFNSLRNLKTHLTYHQPPQLSCGYCEKLFYIRKNLREHQESIHLGVTYNCTQCNRSFQSTSGLRRHAKTHCKT